MKNWFSFTRPTMMLIVALAASLFVTIEAASLTMQLGVVSTLINSLSTAVVRVVSSLLTEAICQNAHHAIFQRIAHHLKYRAMGPMSSQCRVPCGWLVNK